jgi:hypothetical protein
MNTDLQFCIEWFWYGSHCLIDEPYVCHGGQEWPFLSREIDFDDRNLHCVGYQALLPSKQEY